MTDPDADWQRAGAVHDTWSARRTDRAFMLHAAATFITLVVMVSCLARFLAFVEMRPGIRLPDPVLAGFSPVDVSWVTFGLIYLGIILGLVTLSQSPRRLLLTMQAYSVMVAARIGMMFVMPLDPPEPTIALVDPIVGHVVGHGATLMKDLFFSGHTSTLFLLALTAVSRKMRTVFLICTVLVGVCVLIQHTHYTVDVLVAPFVAYVSYRVIVLLHRRFNLR